MRRLTALLLAFMLMFTMAMMPVANAEDELFVPEGGETENAEPIEREPLPTELFVGTTTKVSGYFFTDLWGSNTSDIDVRNLIHGYNTVIWTTQTAFSINPTVVSEIRYQDYANGEKSYTLYLVDGLTYNDGTPITARDFVFNILFNASPEAKALGGSTVGYSQIVGFEAYNNGESESFSGVSIIDDMTFSIRVKAECLPFFYENSYFRCQPYPISVIAPGCEVASGAAGAFIRNADADVEEDLFTPEILTETLFNAETGYMSHPYLTCGAYKLVEYDAEAGTLVFEKNPYYLGNYDGTVPTIEKITLKWANKDTMIDQLAAGEYTLLNKLVDAETIDAGLALEGIVAENYTRIGYGFISFACEKGPQQSLAVRQAVSYAFDKTKFLQEFLGAYGMEVYSYYGIGQWMAQSAIGSIEHANLEPNEQEEWDKVTLEELNTYAFDLEKAKALLVEDGWVLGADGKAYVEGTRYKDVDGALTSLTLKWAKTKDNSRGAEVLKEILVPELEKIGFAIEITEMPFTDLLKYYYRQEERTYDMFFLATNFHDVFDPYTIYLADEAYQGNINTTGFSDDTLTRLAKEMRETEQGDLLNYYLRWFEYVKYYNQIIPTIPIYSNIYMDLRADVLLGYNPEMYSSWSNAIIYAYFGYPEDEVILLEGEGEGGEELLNP